MSVAATRKDKVLQVLLGRTPAPRAWDDVFPERLTAYLRIQTVDGAAVAGLFADESYAGGFPHDADLYLEQAWSLNDDGSLKNPSGTLATYRLGRSHAWRSSPRTSWSEHGQAQDGAALGNREAGRLDRW